MTTPVGYESTAVWAAFCCWLDEDEDRSEDDWPAFRDGYSAGLAEQDT